MPDFIATHSLVESALSTAASNALVASLLAVPAWAASRWLKPTIAHAMWLLVLAKLLTPPLVDVPLPLDAALAMFGADTRNAGDDAAKTRAKSTASDVASADDSLAVIASEPTRVPLVADDGADGIAAVATTSPILLDVPAHSPDSPSMRSEMPTVVWSSPGLADQAAEDRTQPFPASFAVSQQSNEADDTLVAMAARRDEAAASAESPMPNEITAVIAQSDPAATNDAEHAAALALLDHARPILAILWLCGACVWIIVAATRLRRFRRAMRHATPATPPLQAEVAVLAERIGLAWTPDVRIVASQVSPLVWTPLCRAVLVLPRELMSRFSAEQRAAVIAHELAHLRRRDHWTRWLELIAVGCYWWLPTVWFARRRLHQAEETCCDAWVVWLLPERRRDYARALLETIDFLHSASETPLLASGFARPSSLKRRFDMILARKSPHRLSWPGRFAVAATGLLVLPWSLSTLSADDESAPRLAVASDGASSSAERVADAPAATAKASHDSIPGAAAISESPPAAASDDQVLDAPKTPPAGSRPSLDASSSNDEEVPTPRRVNSQSSSGDSSLPTTSQSTPVFDRAASGEAKFVTDDAKVLQRLARLEATTAELLAIVKQLRDEQQGGRTGPIAFATPVVQDGVVVCQLKVNGRQISAVDAKTGKPLWSTTAPGNVTAIQSIGQRVLEAFTADGTTLILDVATGATPFEASGTNIFGRPTAVEDRASSGASTADAVRGEQVAKIEMEMLDVERKLAQERAELQHEVRQLETRRTRLARRLDATPVSETNTEDRAKLTAELEEAEDQLSAMQHRMDIFEADLDFKVRELQIRRSQMLRELGSSSADTSNTNPPAPPQSQPPRRR
ncbi:MAG: M56 family metallopeptidase [Pirellulales bacterium]